MVKINRKTPKKLKISTESVVEENMVEKDKETEKKDSDDKGEKVVKVTSKTITKTKHHLSGWPPLENGLSSNRPH